MADSDSDNDSTASSQVTDIFYATPSPLAQAAHGPTPRLRTPEDVKKYEYLRRVEACGGFKVYEKAHTQALATTFAKRFEFIPEEIFPRIVAFWAHAGFYESAAANRLIAEERLRKMPNDEFFEALLRRAKTMNDEELDKVRTLLRDEMRKRGMLDSDGSSDSEGPSDSEG